MTIAVGDKLPDAVFKVRTPDGLKDMSTADVFAGKKVALFAVPGAFTPTCSMRHMPGYLENLDTLRAKGVDRVACIAVNDPFVMQAWAKDQGVDNRITMLADGTGAFTKALGLELDLSARGLGIRSQRFVLVAKNGKVTQVAVEAPGAFEVSKAETVLAAL